MINKTKELKFNLFTCHWIGKLVEFDSLNSLCISGELSVKMILQKLAEQVGAGT